MIKTFLYTLDTLKIWKLVKSLWMKLCQNMKYKMLKVHLELVEPLEPMLVQKVQPLLFLLIRIKSLYKKRMNKRQFKCLNSCECFISIGVFLVRIIHDIKTKIEVFYSFNLNQKEN